MARGFKPPSNYVPKKRSGKTLRAGKLHAATKQQRPRPEKKVQSASEKPVQRSEQHVPRLPNQVYEPLPATRVSSTAAQGVSFSDLGFGPRMVRELAKQGAVEPFPIQFATIPDALAGRNILGQGSTGSGKTIAFGAALVERLFTLRGSHGRMPGRAPQALVLAPTRELALQIDSTIQPFARALGFFTTQLYGGVPAARQREGLKRGVDIVIGTPGRINDLADRGSLDLSQIVITVLDEADIMSDMGFLEQVNSILFRTRPTGQRMLFSATLDMQVRALVQQYMPDPAVYEVVNDRPSIDHRVLMVKRDDKDEVAARLAGAASRALVFTRTKLGADRLVSAFSQFGVRSLPLHGDLTQEQRTANLEAFQQAKVQVLVATDVAARGIHVDNISLVVQFDPPLDHKTYVHRAGRTGRADAHGSVATLVTPSHRERMARLLKDADISASFLEVTRDSIELKQIADAD